MPSTSILTARLTGASLTLTWMADATGGAATSFIIEVGTGPGLSNAAILDTGSPLTSFFHPAVPGGQAFFVRVRAKNGVGSSAASNDVMIVVVQ